MSGAGTEFGWMAVRDGDMRALALADRHYSRQKPGTPLFIGPGHKLALVTTDGLAVWGVRLAMFRADGRAGDWECVIFRNEGPYLSSHLIVLALAHTRWLWGEPPTGGMFTFIGHGLRGGCFHAAGFHRDGQAADGRLCLRLAPERFPPAMRPAEWCEQIPLPLHELAGGGPQ